MIQNIKSWSEIECYGAINDCGAFIWRMNHDMADGRIPYKDHADIDIAIEKMRKYQLDVVAILPKFGVKLNEDLSATPEYWKWFHWWDEYCKNLSDAENDELASLIEKNEDVSKFRPVGSWQ